MVILINCAFEKLWFSTRCNEISFILCGKLRFYQLLLDEYCRVLQKVKAIWHSCNNYFIAYRNFSALTSEIICNQLSARCLGHGLEGLENQQI